MDDRAIGIVVPKRRRIDPPGEVHVVCFADGTIRPRLVLLHDDEAADRPMVLSVAGVVVVGSPEVGTHHNHQSVGDTLGLREVPQVVDAIGQLCKPVRVEGVVVGVRVEAPQCQIRTDRGTRPETQHRELRLASQSGLLAGVVDRIGETLQALGAEGGPVLGEPAGLGRNQFRGFAQAIRRLVRVGLQRRPVGLAEVPTRRGGRRCRQRLKQVGVV